MSPHHSDQMSQCHKSLGPLCSVLKTLIVSGAGPTKGPTKGQGHLLSCRGTAKNREHSHKMQRVPTSEGRHLFLVDICQNNEYFATELKKCILERFLVCGFIQSNTFTG